MSVAISARAQVLSHVWFSPLAQLIMAVAPGTGSPAGIQAAIALLDAGLSSLLDGKGVSALSQAKLALAGYVTVAHLALVEDTRAEFRQWLAVGLGLDVAADPTCKLEVTTLVGCWEAAKLRFERRNAADAEAAASRLPKIVPRIEHLELRAKFELQHYKLEDAVTPSKALLESLFESIEEGELKPLALKDLVSVDEADDQDEMIAGFDSSGALRLKKGRKEVPPPVNSEQFRRRMKVLGHLYAFCKIRYPSKPWLADFSSRLFEVHADFFCGEQVMGLQAKNEDGLVVSTPSFQLCLSYDYQLRKEVGKLVNQGSTLKAALEAATRDTTIRERFFTTPCAMQVRAAFSGPNRGNHWDPGATQAAGQARNRNPSTDGNSGKGQLSKKSRKSGDRRNAKGKGKGGRATHTPDGRQLCFGYNNTAGCTTKACARVHCCQGCFGKHPLHSCPAANAAAAGPSTALANPAAPAAARPAGG